MPKTIDTPPGLKAYVFHGVEFGEPDSSGNALADCPFCGKEGKLSVHKESSVGRCWGGGCDERLNSMSFLQKLHKLSDAQTEDYDWILKHRRLLSWETLDRWGVVKSALRGDWLLPGYNLDNRLSNLYRYSIYNGRGTVLSTPGCNHQLYGVQLYDPNKSEIHLLEGPWDGIAWWEALRNAKETEDGLKVTGNEEGSMLRNINVLATPSCNVFDPKWATLFSGKDVVLMFDSDHPRVGPDKVERKAGYDGMRRVAEILMAADDPPARIRFLRWGPNGYDGGRPSGYDVRDFITQAATVAGRVALIPELTKLFSPIPEDWGAGRTKEAKKNGGTVMKTTSCHSWKELVTAWKKALRWSEGLDRALSVMLASVASTPMIGDQLWVRVISPPSTGKTQLCEGIGTARQFIKGVGNFTGLHSGFQTDRHGDEDHSLISQLDGKTLVVKDGDTLLRATNRDKIMSQVRDAYDTNCAVAYGNRVKREYNNHRFTFILAGTESLMEMDAAELGARFVDVIIMREIDPDMEDDINLRNFHRIVNNRAVIANGTPDSQDDPATIHAKSLTGGYVEFLRRNSSQLLAVINTDNSGEVGPKVSAYAQFIAFMRARPSKKQQEAVTREMSARLTNQLSKLTFCLTIVLGKPRVDDEVLRRVRQTARDTARGNVLRITEALYEKGHEGMPSTNLSLFTDDNESQVRRLLRFMRAIGAAERYTTPTKNGIKGKPHWRLTTRMQRLYRETMFDGEVQEVHNAD